MKDEGGRMRDEGGSDTDMDSSFRVHPSYLFAAAPMADPATREARPALRSTTLLS
jgi:hypothetical protein